MFGMQIISTPNASIRSLYHSKSGNIAILFALIFPIILLMIGGAIDYAIAVQKKGKIQHAADMAVLAALKTYNNDDVAEEDRKHLSLKAGREVLESNVANLGIGLDDFTFNLKDENESHNVASFDWTAHSKTNFLKLIGIEQITLGDHVEAVMAPSRSSFVDLHIMVDLSSSMGIPSTKAGISAITEGTGCQFTCHEKHNLNERARRLGIELRMDVVQSAIANIADKIASLGDNSAEQHRVAIHGFTKEGRTILPATGDMNMVKTVASNLEVEKDFTFLKNGIGYLRSQVGEQGTGKTKDDPIKIPVFLSDGLHSDDISWPYFTKTIGDVDCRMGKEDNEIKLYVVYTTYETYRDHLDHYGEMVEPHEHKIGPEMEACASENAFYQTSNAADIRNAFDEIFVEFTSATSLRLTK